MDGSTKPTEAELSKMWKSYRRRWRTAATQKRWFDVRAIAGDFLAYCEDVGHWPDWWHEADRMIDDAWTARLIEQRDSRGG